MKLRLKLLIPTVSFTLILTGTVTFIFADHYRMFKDRTNRQTALGETNIRETFTDHIADIRQSVELINNNEVFVSGVLVGEQQSVLNVLELFADHSMIDFAGVYRLDGSVFAQTPHPDVFGNRDDLKPWVERLSEKDEPVPTVMFHNEKLALVTGKRIRNMDSPIGVTVAGIWLDNEYIRQIASGSGHDLALKYDESLLFSTSPDKDFPTHDSTEIAFDELLVQDRAFSLLLMEDNTAAAKEFLSHIITVLATVLSIGVFSIAISMDILQSVFERLNEALVVLRKAESGDLSTRINAPADGDEITELHTGIDSMIARLEEMVETLEMKVEDRTRQLRQKTGELEKAGKIAEIEKDKAEEANRAKSAFLANISHELRTPLNAILGFAQFMESDTNFPAAHGDNLKVITRSGAHLLTLINDVLEMSKIEAGRIVLNTRYFDLRDMICDVEEMMRLKAREKGLRLVVDVSSDTCHHIETDDRKLRQILINLVGNAVKFTEKGYVFLNVRNEPNGKPDGDNSRAYIRFDVEDTGPGISKDEKDKLFNPFVQTSSAQNSFEGTGLGLAISRQFVRLMGGELELADRPDSPAGSGALFTFKIEVKPVSAIKNDKPKALPRIVGLKPGQPAYRILIADDIEDNRLLLAKFLESAGFETRQVKNGKEALDQAGTWLPHLIWMDMRMPVMNGLEATRKIRKKFGNGIRIVGLSASIFEEDRKCVLAEGCDDFIRKPFEREEIFDVMSRQLGVRYETETCMDGTANRPAVPETPVSLPEALRDDIRRAAEAFDPVSTMSAVECLCELKVPAAESLKYLAENYDFDKILELTNPHQI